MEDNWIKEKEKKSVENCLEKQEMFWKQSSTGQRIMSVYAHNSS